MKNIGGNLERLKIKNRQLILRLLNNHGKMSRKLIAQTISLTSASITQLCSEMIAEGLIVEVGEDETSTKAGRKEIFININYENRYALCINIEKFSTDISLANLQGNVILTKRIKTATRVDAEIFLKQVADTCLAFLEQAAKKIIGVGVSLRGLVDSAEGVSKKAYEIWSKPVAVKDILESYLPFPIIVQNNMRAFAQAEIIYGIGKEYKNLLFLKWFPGVGSSIVIDQAVYEGEDGRAAELGHYIVDSDGRRCRCGKCGCLETVTSFDAIVSNISLIYSKEMTPLLYEATRGERMNIASVVKNYLKTDLSKVDAYVKETIDKAIAKIAVVAFNAMTFMAPQKLIVYGEFFANEYIYCKFVEKYKTYEIDYKENLIIKTNLSDKIFYIGALAIVVEQFFFNVGGL